MKKLSMQTPNLADDNFQKLVQLFPNAVSETVNEQGEVVRAIDADVLRQEINTQVVEGTQERYQFTWPDKRLSMLLANSPTTATLRPVREDSVDFDATQNLYIEGDNLEVLKVLRETYLNRVKMIYIDPPYNTGNDFVYEDDFAGDTQDFLRRDGQYDAQGMRMVTNLDSNGRFHTDWLNMMYPRLRLARNLLTDDGVIFISINDNEVDNLKKICNEVFGEDNFVADLIWSNKEGGGSSDSKLFRIKHEHILCYSKNVNLAEIIGTPISNEERYTQSDEYEEIRGKYYLQKLGMGSIQYSESLDYPIETPDGKTITPKENNNGRKACWRWSKEKYMWGIDNGFIVIKKDSKGIWTVYTKQYINCDNEGNIITRTQRPFGIIDEFSSTQASKYLDSIGLGSVFSYSKPFELLKYLIERIDTKNNGTILDFFSGSATTAHAVMQLNAEDGGKRQFIMVQIPEATDEKSEAYKAGYNNICEIGKERIRRAGQKIKEEVEQANAQLRLDETEKAVPDIGFRVLRLDSSNVKDVYYTPEEFKRLDYNLEGFLDNIKPDRSEEDLLFQVMLELGIPLSSRIEREGAVYSVNEGYLMACFGRVDTELLTQIAKQRPQYAVFRDSSFLQDSALVNFEQVFKTYSPDTIRRVL